MKHHDPQIDPLPFTGYVTLARTPTLTHTLSLSTQAQQPQPLAGTRRGVKGGSERVLLEFRLGCFSRWVGVYLLGLKTPL